MATPQKRYWYAIWTPRSKMVPQLRLSDADGMVRFHGRDWTTVEDLRKEGYCVRECLSMDEWKAEKVMK